MARKMPKPSDHMVNGKVDMAKFLGSDFDTAKEAIASGDTAIRKIVIEQGNDGLVHVRISREHSPKKAGMPPALMTMLTDVLHQALSNNTVSMIGPDRENGNDNQDTWEVDLKPA